MIGIYHPGSSLLHRTPAWIKLILLLAAVIEISLIRDLWWLGGAAAVTVLLYVIAWIPPRVALAQLRPLLWVVPFVAGFQLIFTGWRPAVLAAGILLVNVALAALFTLTTSVTAILDLCRTTLHPFRRWVDPDRVGLMMALAIRCVPLAATLVGEVWQARKARGVTGARNVAVAIAAPTVVRALRTADALGEALRARGVDD